MRKIFPFMLAMISTATFAQNAVERATRGIAYSVVAKANFSNDNSPFWMTSNRYGLSSVYGDTGYLCTGITRSVENDSLNNWRIGYGIEFAGAYNFTSPIVVQQAYADIEYKSVRFSIGAKERPMQLKNPTLSSGSLTLGINARPIPEVRLELPKYRNVAGRCNWAAVKGYIGYGLLTDGRFAKDYVRQEGRYSDGVIYHSKAGYLRLGNAKKFPLTFEGGLEMACYFGGKSYNTRPWGVQTNVIRHRAGIKDFFNALIGLGSDSTDGEGYENAAGNSLGSWVFSLKYHGKEWGARVYYDHFFEDHSQMFFEYGWKDGLWGIEVELPRNAIISTAVYEFANTTYQSGPIYHDSNNEIPDQISGADDYYQHALFAGHQHWGQAVGSPLFLSPLYNHNASLDFTSNRFQAHHLGISGDPLPALNYRLLYTHIKSYGTYGNPFDEIRRNHSFLAEASYKFPKGWQAAFGLGIDHGKLTGNNIGVALTVKHQGLLTR